MELINWLYKQGSSFNVMADRCVSLFSLSSNDIMVSVASELKRDIPLQKSVGVKKNVY